MARPLRIELAGAVYHVMSRGNARQDIVLDDADREKRRDWLRRTVEVYGWPMHALVLMRNHDHLFMETPEPNLSARMQSLNGSYTSYFDRRHRRCGHLFPGRCQGHLIQQRSYFLEVSRSIHLNPVRAKVVARPEPYPWSSDGGYQRANRTVAWVTYDQVLGEFSVFLGLGFGQDTTRWSPGRRSDDASRAVAAYLARRRFGYAAGTVAAALGYRSASSIPRAVARVESGNQRLQRTVAKLERSLR